MYETIWAQLNSNIANISEFLSRFLVFELFLDLDDIFLLNKQHTNDET